MPGPQPARSLTGPAPAAAPARFAIVGVGASAGGLEAFGQLLGALPPDTGMAFVLVQHLDPVAPSSLASLLAARTSMPVVEVAADTAVEPDHVYVITPGVTLALVGDTLHVAPRGEGLHLPVDALFMSLADQRPGRIVGVVLSGTGSDGTRGLEAIRAADGVTFAQDAGSASFADMPRNAVRSGCVDRVLPPEQIGWEIALLRGHPLLARPDPGLSPSADGPGGEEGEEGEDASPLADIVAMLRSVSGVDFAAYRPTTLRRRIDRRVILTRSASLAAYADLLAADPEEVAALYHDVLIHVTSFFRDPEAFEALRELVFPKLVLDRDPSSAIRVWVPGCSTGQEAYSLAMALIEFVEDRGLNLRVQVFATDLSEEVALKRAREGRYPETIEAEVSPARLTRFFTRDDDGYRVGKALRACVVFARQDVGADPPFSHMDLVSCRNLLIYLSPQLQRRVIATLHFALEPAGFLLLGASETLGGAAELFEPISPEHRIYAKRPSQQRHPWFPRTKARAKVGERAPAGPTAPDSRQEADRIVLAHWGPPGVLLGADDRVLQIRGDTSPFLDTTATDPASPLRGLREGLFEDVQAALRECRETGAPVVRTGVRYRYDGAQQEVDLLLFPVMEDGGADRSVLLVFDRTSRRPHDLASRAVPAWPSWMPRWLVGRAQIDEVGQLRRELTSTRAYLQSVIDRQEAVNEVLASTNEEAVSANEELQSTNEELETAQEELQSLNEELTTVNEQLLARNADLTRLSDDLVNLLESAAVPMVALDHHLAIRRFTPSAGRAFHLIPSDVGRPMVDLRSPVDVQDLEALCRAVLATGEVVTREIRDDHGCWHALRVHPYRTAEGGVEGAVLVLADIDAAKRVQDSIAQARDQATSIVETVSEPLLVLDRELRVLSANRAFYRYHALAEGKLEGTPLSDVAGGVWSDKVLQTLLLGVLGGGPPLEDHAFRQELPDGTARVGRLNARRIEGNSPEQLLLAILDETEQHRLTGELRRYADELREGSERKNDFLATLAHELRNPLTPIRNALAVRRLMGQSEQAAAEDAMMDRQVHHLTRLVDDLLDISRISLGRIDLRLQRLELGRAVRALTELERAAATEAGLELDVTTPDAPVWIEADPVRLDQIVGNLLTNAIKYTPAGGRITVTLTTDGPDAVLEVADDGIGIPAATLPRVWDLYVQGEEPAYRSRGGIGIGLSLVRKLAQLHHGSVSAASDGPGRGSRFTVRLPCTTAPIAAPPPARAAASGGAHARRRRVLVVDDTADVANSLGRLLGLMGHDVRVASDGPTAILTAMEFRPEVVFLDIGLGAMGGLEVAKRLRAEPTLAGVKLVALTGYGTDEDRARSMDAGFDLHLVKPVDPDQFEAILALPDRIPQPDAEPRDPALLELDPQGG